MSELELMKRGALAFGAVSLAWLVIFLIGYGAVAFFQDVFL